MLVKQVLYHLSHTPDLFALVIFQIGSFNICPGWLQTVILLPIPSAHLELNACATHQPCNPSYLGG
jgi:hypothetical protein